MKKSLCVLSAVVALSASCLAQSSTVFYANTSDRLGTLTGWETRGPEVLFNDLATFPAPIGGLAVSHEYVYAVSVESPSRYYIFDLNDPSVILETGTTSVNILDSLVYDPYDGVVYAHSDQGIMYTFDPDGTQTVHGELTGPGVGGTPVVWGSHGDLAIARDSSVMYQIGFDVALQDETSVNWHSLLRIDTGDLTGAVRIGQVPYNYGRIWGLAFDEYGSLFAVTSDSYMLEIDPSNGGILWSAPIVDSNGNSVALWDMASNPHSVVPEPSSSLLVMLMGACALLRRGRSA